MALTTLTLIAIFSILVGILILIFPESLNYFVATWLILWGILQILVDAAIL